jgi:ankyrin repeat protein
MLLNRGPGIEAKTTDNVTALHCAASNGHVEVAKLLLAEGLRLRQRIPTTGLRFASRQNMGHEAVVQLLAEKRADVKSPNSNGWKALFVVVKNGHEAAVKLLLDVGVSINTREYWEALQAAAYNGKEGVCAAAGRMGNWQ